MNSCVARIVCIAFAASALRHSGVVTPQVKEYNAPLTVMNVSPPDTGTGVVLAAVVVPLPSWPRPLAPQQYAAPPVVTPQAPKYRRSPRRM